MRYVKRAVCSLLMAALLCLTLTGTVVAAETASIAEDGILWLDLSVSSGKTVAQIVTDVTVTDGVIELDYDSSVLTYESVDVTEAYVAMYAVNAETEGAVRISWVAPEEYAPVEDGAGLIRVNFTGEAASAASFTLTGSGKNASGQTVTIGSKEATGETTTEETVSSGDDGSASASQTESDSSAAAASTDGAATSDAAQTTLYLGLLACCTAALAGVVLNRNRRERR